SGRSRLPVPRAMKRSVADRSGAVPPRRRPAACGSCRRSEAIAGPVVRPADPFRTGADANPDRGKQPATEPGVVLPIVSELVRPGPAAAPGYWTSTLLLMQGSEGARITDSALPSGGQLMLNKRKKCRVFHTAPRFSRGNEIGYTAYRT